METNYFGNVREDIERSLERMENYVEALKDRIRELEMNEHAERIEKLKARCERFQNALEVGRARFKVKKKFVFALTVNGNVLYRGRVEMVGQWESSCNFHTEAEAYEWLADFIPPIIPTEAEVTMNGRFGCE